MMKITLKAARVNAGLTQKAAARALGVSNTTLVNWENEKNLPNQKYINAICDLYGVPYDALLFSPANPV